MQWTQKKILDRSKRKFWIKDLTLDYNSFEICHLKILVKIRNYLKSLICHLKIWRGNLELIFNWNALPWFPYLTCKREIQRFLLCWPDPSQWVEFYSLEAFQNFIFLRYSRNILATIVFVKIDVISCENGGASKLKFSSE